MNQKTPSETDIARKAYELWEAEGRPEGRDVAHWHQAERNITDPVVVPIPAAPPPPAEDTPEDTAGDAPGDVAATAAKPRATRARKPKPVDGSVEAAARPKAPRRRKAAEPKA